MSKKNSIIILVLLLIGIYLRVNGTFQGLFAFTFDQGRDLMAVKETIEQHKLYLIGPPSGIEGTFHGVWWYWLLTLISLLVKGNPLFIVAVMNMLSSFGIIIGYLLGKKVKNNTLGLICAFLISFSLFFIRKSAQLWNPNVVPVLVLGLLYFIYENLRGKRSLFWVGLLLGAIFEFHLGFGGMLTATSVITLLIIKRRFIIKDFLKSLIGFGLFIWPRILFDLRHHLLQFNSFIAYLNNPKTVHSTQNILARFVDRTKLLWSLFIESFSNYNQIVGVIFLLIILWYLIKLYQQKSSQIEKLFISFILINILLLLILASIYPDTLWSYYFIGMPGLILPLVALSLYQLFQIRPKLIYMIMLIFLTLNLTPWTWFKKDVVFTDPSIYKYQLQIVDTIYHHIDNQPFNVQTYTPSMIDYNYQYLFTWYGKKHYGTVPERNIDTNTVFFIIEPDPWQNGYRDIWIRDRIGDGKIVWQQEFVDGVRVEERIRDKKL